LKQSAGLLLWRKSAVGVVEVLLVHPSGSYNAKAPWSIPKGEPNDGEAIDVCARREVAEETGVVVTGAITDLGHIDYKKSRKRVFAFGAPLPAEQTPRVAQWEIDRAEMLAAADARAKIHPDQAVFIDRLLAALGGT
jgi:predicted NUDIX family NTP pyrophosphohydrolase